MPPRQTSNQQSRDWRNRGLTLPSSPSPATPNALHSFHPADQVVEFYNAPAQYHPLQLQPPSAPRMHSVPLPRVSPTHSTFRVHPPRRDVFPIDLTSEVDFHALARGVLDFNVPPHTTVYIMPTSRERSLLQITTEEGPARASTVLRRVQSIIRAHLSLQVYRTQLEPAVQTAVREHFLSRSGRHGVQLWQAFLNGVEHPHGPRGVVLLEDHIHMWGFSLDHSGQWMVHVDVPPVSEF
ncbi:hypothetical protein DFH06DRAFT_1485931 [Mycena polygramma]|nr:hypothetical protein DFH06DRAFT_1485931 [Mycena polygramma]